MIGQSKKNSWLKIGAWLLVVTGAMYVTSCSFIAESRGKAFDAVVIGDSEENVVNRFGSTFRREKNGEKFQRYATQECSYPCVERLWFENRLAFDTEAWSIELDESRHVIKKSYWNSP